MRMSRFQVVRSLLIGLRGLAVVAVLLGSASAIEAQTVITLAWDANTEPNLAGYQVSYGTQSGVYSTIVDVGNVTSRSFTLTSGVVYYFAVKAYNSASPRQYSPYSIEVPADLRTTPVVTWTPPASVVPGTVLGATQLNATANVAGTFVYSPAHGTVLTAGTQTLSVTFTPTDAVNYTTATKTVTIDVTLTAPVITYGIALGTADFNGDGKPDILWRNATRGENYVWFMDGVTRTGGAYLDTVADLNWKFVGTGDFTGDGKPDILWQNATTGQNYVWYMNGVTRTGGTFLDTVADPNWKIVGTGDLSGDGKPDLLWRNTSTGVNYAWYMNGVTRTGGAYLVTVADLNWSMAVVADFNGDGKPDVLWRHSVTGENILWYLDGATRVSYEWVLTIAPNWQIGQRQ